MSEFYTSLKETKSKDDLEEIQRIINKYKANNFTVPIIHLLITLFIVFFCFIGIKSTNNNKIIGVYVVLLAFTLVRLFIIFHDMVHKSFFPSNERDTKTNGINFYSSFLLQPFIFYSSYDWNKVHSHHHSVHGNSSEYDGTKTVINKSDYDKMPYILRLLYDFFHIPILFYPFLSLYVFFLRNIIMFDFQFMLLLLILILSLYKFGKMKLVCSFLMAVFIAGILGVMLFHLQHQVNIGYYQPFDNDDYVEKKNADLKGASVLKVPCLLKFFTFGIEYHNVHHFDPGVPGYNIKQCHRELVDKGLIEKNEVSYLQSFKSLFHSYYDEKTNKYTSNSFFRNLGLEA